MVIEIKIYMRIKSNQKSLYYKQNHTIEIDLPEDAFEFVVATFLAQGSHTVIHFLQADKPITVLVNEVKR